MITVVIPNYNGKGYLKECINSIKNQKGIEYELIIVDNASTDCSYDWEKNQAYITWIQLQKNYGFSKAVNEGIKKAKGKYILLLNNDTVIESDFLGQLVTTIESDTKIFAVSSKMIAYHDRNVIDDAGDEYNLLGWAKKRGDGQPVELFTQPQQVFSACAGAALYRKSIFDEIGYFDEKFFAYMEDIDISYRANIYGYKNVYAPKAKVYHIGSATSGSRHNAFKVELAARNNIYVVYKNMPLIQLIINVPFLILGCCIKYLFFTIKGLEKPYRKGLISGLQTAGHMQKVPFKWIHLKNYIAIELQLIKNLILFVNKKG